MATANTVFQVEQDRVLNEAATLACCCPKVDLIALVVGTAEVTVYRLHFQRVFATTLPARVTCLCWASNGRILVAGCENGSMHMLNVEDGAVLFSSTVSTHPITVLQWMAMPGPSQTPAAALARNSNPATEFAELRQHVPDGSSVVYRSQHFAMFGALQLLAVGDAGGTLALYAMGMLPLMKIKLDAAAVQQCVLVDRHLYVLSGSPTAASLHSLDMSSLLDNADYLLSTAMLVIRSQELADVLAKALGAIEHAWRGWLASFFALVGQYPQVAQQFLSEQTLLDAVTELLAVGRPSPAMQQFLGQNMSEAAIKRLLKSLESTVPELENLFDRFALKAVSQLSVGDTEGIAASLQDAKQGVRMLRDEFLVFLQWLTFQNLLLEGDASDDVKALAAKFADPQVLFKLLTFLEARLDGRTASYSVADIWARLQGVDSAISAHIESMSLRVQSSLTQRVLCALRTRDSGSAFGLGVSSHVYNNEYALIPLLCRTEGVEETVTLWLRPQGDELTYAWTVAEHPSEAHVFSCFAFDESSAMMMVGPSQAAGGSALLLKSLPEASRFTRCAPLMHMEEFLMRPPARLSTLASFTCSSQAYHLHVSQTRQIACLLSHPKKVVFMMVDPAALESSDS
jgi:hypothetical protein